MASPFSVFRRNQKVLLAIVGIGAMVAFVFLDPLMKYVGRSKGSENPVVVTTKYGPVTEAEMAGIRQSRELVEAFLQAVSIETVRAQIAGGRVDARMQDRALEQWYGTWRQEVMGRSKPGPEEAALETLILSKRAEQLGMVISDRAINDLLKQITVDTLNSDTLQQIINSLQGGRKVTVSRLFEAIRTEMLASKVSQLFRVSLGDIPPAQRFDYYERLNRRAKAEVIPLAVAEFTKQVPDPSAEELQKFYEAHKNRFPDPNSPEPGFKQPKRAAFQYFKADYAKLKDELKPLVTDQEIADYYEKNKTQFPVAAATEETKPEGAASDSEPKTEGEKPADGDSSPEAKPAEDKPAEDAKAADEGTTPEPKPEADKPAAPQSAIEPRATIRLVSFTAADDEQPATETPAVESAPPESKPAEPATEAPPAEDKKPDSEAAEEKPEESRYEPLEKVTDTIRDRLAGEKAGKRIGEAFDELSAEMRRYADDLEIFNATKGSNSSAKPPKPFPFKELAEAKQVVAKETDLITAAEATSSTDIGHVRRFIPDRRSQFGFRSEPFSEFAFAESLVTYKPSVVEDNDGNVYLFWKTKEEAAYVPTLEQIRDKVAQAWKLIEARDIARKRADEYATQARAAKQPLKEFFGTQANLTVTETNSFSWLTTGNVPFDPGNSQPRVSQVDGVDKPGEDFMSTVFSLAPGGVGVAMNHPQDMVYIIRLLDYEQPAEELRKDFATENQQRYMSVAAPEQRQMYLAWLDNLEKEADVHWMRQADVARRRAADIDLGNNFGDDFSE